MSIFTKLFGKQNGDGETPEFNALVEGSMEGLRLQTEAHQGAWRLGKSERWDFSQDTGDLVFTFPDMIVRAPAQIIGSFDSRALANRLCATNGVYRGPAGATFVFFTFGQVQLSKKT